MSENTKDLKYLFCGGVSGCISRTAVAPLERLKIMYQVQDILTHEAKYTGIRASLRRIWIEESWKGLYKGNGTNCVRVFPYTATQFLVFEKLKPILTSEGHSELSPIKRLIGGAISGVVSVCLTYPLDFVRARLTVQDSMFEKRYNGIWHALRTISQTEGFLGLYRGISPTIMGIAPYVGLNFMVFETLKQHAPKDDTGKPSILHLLGYGAIAGACGQTAAYPFDLLRRRCQLNTLSTTCTLSTTTWKGFQEIITTEGFLGLYKGIGPNFIKVVPSIAVMFVSNEMLKYIVM